MGEGCGVRTEMLGGAFNSKENGGKAVQVWDVECRKVRWVGRTEWASHVGI